MSHQDKHDNIDLTIVSVKNRKRKNPLKQEHPQEHYQQQQVGIEWRNPASEDQSDPFIATLDKLRVEVKKRKQQQSFE